MSCAVEAVKDVVLSHEKFFSNCSKVILMINSVNICLYFVCIIMSFVTSFFFFLFEYGVCHILLN